MPPPQYTRKHAAVSRWRCAADAAALHTRCVHCTPGQQEGEGLAHGAADPDRQQPAPEAKHKAGAQDEDDARQEEGHHGGVHAWWWMWWGQGEGSSRGRHA